MMKMNWDRMSSDGVRAIKGALGTDRIHGRHVNCVNGPGAKRIHGKVHVVDNETYIESMLVETADQLMKKEMRDRGDLKPKSDFISAWSTRPSTPESVVEPAPTKKRRKTTAPNYATA